MSSHKQVDSITKQFKKIVQQKYDIIEIKLFGSSARADFSKNSDIDIMVKLPKVNRKIEEALFDIAYDLELEHDCVIDVIVLSAEMETGIPLYQNIAREGVAI